MLKVFVFSSQSLFVEYEVKSLTIDFDKVVRKQIARLKKAKQ